MGLLASRVHPRRRRRFSNPLGLEPRLSISLGHICFSQTFFFVLLFRLSFVSYFLSSSRDLPLPRRDFLFISVSRDHIDHPLLLPLSFSPSNCSLSFTMRPPPSIFPSHLPGFYLSFTSTRLARSPVTRGETPSLLLIDPRFLLLIHT